MQQSWQVSWSCTTLPLVWCDCEGLLPQVLAIWSQTHPHHVLGVGETETGPEPAWESQEPTRCSRAGVWVIPLSGGRGGDSSGTRGAEPRRRTAHLSEPFQTHSNLSKMQSFS